MDLCGSWNSINELLPPLGLPAYSSCSCIPDPPLKLPVLVQFIGMALFGHAVCVVFLLLALGAIIVTRITPSRAQQRLVGIALLSLFVSTATLSGFWLGALRALMAEAG